MIEIKEKDFTSKLTKVFSANGLGSYLSIERMKQFYDLTVRMLTENAAKMKKPSLKLW